MGTLEAPMFYIYSIQHIVKGCSSYKLCFGRAITLIIKHIEECKLISHCKKTQINYYNNHKNESRVAHEYQVGDQLILKNKQSYKY